MDDLNLREIHFFGNLHKVYNPFALFINLLPPFPFKCQLAYAPSKVATAQNPSANASRLLSTHSSTPVRQTSGDGISLSSVILHSVSRDWFRYEHSWRTRAQPKHFLTEPFQGHLPLPSPHKTTLNRSLLHTRSESVWLGFGRSLHPESVVCAATHCPECRCETRDLNEELRRNGGTESAGYTTDRFADLVRKSRLLPLFSGLTGTPRRLKHEIRQKRYCIKCIYLTHTTERLHVRQKWGFRWGVHSDSQYPAK